VAANEAELSGLMRAGLSSFATLVSALLKVAVTVVVLLPASIYLIRLARPGGERRQYSLRRHLSPSFVLAALSFTFAPRYHWSGAILSDEWLECVISIPLIAVLPFAVIVWVVRQMAPTDLARTGAFVGLFAGCVSAIGYAVHCADDSVPFFALLWRRLARPDTIGTCDLCLRRA